jgi:L-cysteine desulfidase
MAGCKLPVMSSCDSGDHGLTVSIPQYAYAKFNKINELKLLQALAFSHIIT